MVAKAVAKQKPWLRANAPPFRQRDEKVEFTMEELATNQRLVTKINKYKQSIKLNKEQ